MKQFIKGSMFAACGLTAILALGCDDKKASTPEAQKTADDAAATAKDKLSEIKSDVKTGTSDAKDAADKNTEAVKNQAAAMTDQAKKDEAAAKAGADNNQSTLDDYISKAKDAIKDKKWSDADNYVQKISDLKGKLPAEQQVRVDAALTPLKQAIDMGKKAMPGM